MDKKFLDKVLDQIVRETEIDYERELIRYPYTHNLPFHLSPSHFFLTPPLHFSPFIKHCKDVYGLNEQEIDYVWGEYKDIINDKIENNG